MNFDSSVVTRSKVFHFNVSVSALSALTVEPVGRWYEAYALRHLHKHSLSYNSLTSSSSDDNDSELSQDEDDEDDGLLLTLDPKDWKVTMSHLSQSNLSFKLNTSVSDIESVLLGF